MNHGSEEAKKIADKGTILRCLVGSGIHGVSIEGTDDRDEMGICIEPPEYIIGLEQFEQYQYRTQPEGARSGPGDLDLTIYSLRKWMRLATSGNPSILTPLFVAPKDCMVLTDSGWALRGLKDFIISRQAGHRYLGYLNAQKERMLGIRGGAHTNRPELIEQYGFDTKYAMHMVRLGLQGCELLETGHINFPILEPWRSWLLDLRVGKKTKEEALEVADDLEHQLKTLIETSDLPEWPNREMINTFLVAMYEEAWGTG